MSVPSWFYFEQAYQPPSPYADNRKTVVISVSKVPTQPSSPVPIAWNGINSQIKIAASSTTPVKPTTSPSVKPIHNPSPKKKASDPLKASDPPPRPKDIPERTETSTCSNVGSPASAHRLSRGAFI